MPIKWTSDKDQLLLLKILEVHDFKIDVSRVAQAWPADQGEAPTARAITERLAKIRKTVTGGAPTSPFKIAAAPSPAKRKNTSTQNASPKRKKPSKKNEYDSDDVTDNEVGELGDNIIKEEEVDPSVLESPTRRSARGTTSRPNYAQLANGDEDGDDEEDPEANMKQEERTEDGGDTGSEFTHGAGED